MTPHPIGVAPLESGGDGTVIADPELLQLRHDAALDGSGTALRIPLPGVLLIRATAEDKTRRNDVVAHLVSVVWDISGFVAVQPVVPIGVGL